MNLIDTHSHIHFKKEFPDFADVVFRAEKAGVNQQILVGCNLTDSIAARDFVKGKSGLYWSLGIHPHDAKDLDEKNRIKFEEILLEKDDRLVAIGECGLDYFRNLSEPKKQIEVFEWQLNLAQKQDLPVIVHLRDAYLDGLKILKSSGCKKVVLHCFSGGLADAKQAWEFGFITSFSGVVTYPKNQELQDCAKIAPRDLIVVETDCPFLAPQKFRGQRNEPAFVLETAKFIADLRGESLEEFAQSTTQNAQKLFSLN